MAIDIKDLGGKLDTATPWVRDEFAALSGFATGYGCTGNLENGPGLGFRMNGQGVVRLHPKRRYVCVGFPEAMRADVDALVGVRPQKLWAWVNHGQDGYEAEAIELLIDESVRLASNRGQAACPPRQPESRSPVEPSLKCTAPTGASERKDELDLELILALLRAFQQHETETGEPPPVKALREAIFFHWEGPRLPRGGKYSPALLHSAAARERRAARLPGGLVYEHAIPISIVIRRLLRNLPASTRALRDELMTSAERVIITKEEDRAITSAGMATSAPDPNDVWSRYRAAGIAPEDFAPFVSHEFGEPI